MTNDMLGLAGKTAIVWGGGAGMGESTAHLLARAGCRVGIVDKDRNRAEKVAGDLAASGATVFHVVADATDEQQVDKAVRVVEDALGPIDRMATVIGIGVWSSLLDMTLKQWEDAHRSNLTAFFLPARAVARSMIKGGRPGAIVCVSSVSGMTSSPNNAGYGAAKAGMINLIRTMAVEWGPFDIKVNAVAPGIAITPRVQPGPEALAVINRRLPLGRPGTTADIAKAATFLLSDLAGYVTGQNLAVDGGWMSCFLMDSGSRSQGGADLTPLDKY